MTTATKNYYLNAGNFDAYRSAADEAAAVKALFPRAKSVEWAGAETSGEMIYDVEDYDGEQFTVGVTERN